MDQDSRTDESRERALSSEPSSTRPNPFDDSDSTSRKRQRTSLSHSRSPSVETPPEKDITVADSDIHVMMVDTPECSLPHTPAGSNPPTEPVSSRVTINLRNADSLEATPTSPMSPTPLRPQEAHARPSVETSEVDMTTDLPLDDAFSSDSAFDGPEEDVVISVEDSEEEMQLPTSGPHANFRGLTGLRSMVSDFPYRYHDEHPHDTLFRLTGYLRQQNNLDECVLAIHPWWARCVSLAQSEPGATLLEEFRDDRAFWDAIPDLFYHISVGLHHVKPHDIKNLINELMALFAKWTAFLVVTDVHNMARGPITDKVLADLMCMPYLRTLSAFPLRLDDTDSTNGTGRSPDLRPALEIFQSSHGCSLAVLVSFVEYHMAALSQFPRVVLDHLAPACFASHSILRDSFVTQGLERSRSNLALGYKCFALLSDAINVVIEKSINALSQENAAHLIKYSSYILKISLQGSDSEATQRLQQYSQDHPRVPDQYIFEAVALEWRFQLYCKLIRSSQMQLRVNAAVAMCEDLVEEWRRYTDKQQEGPEVSVPNMHYLVYLADFVTETGIVDYILGPTCHPEITATSFNIVGFLGVTKTYTTAQTDLLWHTLTSTQDPRIAEALVRMMVKVAPLLHHGDLIFLLDKFKQVSVDSFTTNMRDLFDVITDHLSKFHSPVPSAYEICVRLLRESSVFTAQGSIAHPDVYHFTQSKLKRLLATVPGEEGRINIASSCLKDVASHSETSSGSLEILAIVAPHRVQNLIEEHDFIPLLINDFEAAVQSARTVGVARVYANPICHARRKFISTIITHHGSAIGPDLGQRLWDYLVGDKAISQEDRHAAWDDFNLALKRKPDGNQFLKDCLELYLPKLPPACYCTGSLGFVREMLVPAANDINEMMLDDEGGLQPPGIEFLWQMILTAPHPTIADDAILTLVNEIYVDSNCILSYPLQRARKVHFSLVHRCLSQLKSAAQRLKNLNCGSTGSDDEPMVKVAIDSQRVEQELRFTRTLKVLTTLSSTLQKKTHFAAPDLRSLMLSSPNTIDGDLAGLKFQSFDGDEQTEVKPLNVGLRNSAASLLASIRQETGFENYRLYFRGTALAPSQADICKSLEELNLKQGLILVKREVNVASSPVRIKPGASPLEIEILGYFNQLWEYLSLEEKLAREIYKFLISLPADDSILTAFESSNTSPREIFPLGQPFKSLYAIHALREYLHTQRLKNTMMSASAREEETHKQSTSAQDTAAVKAMSLIVAAICDPDVIDQCANQDMRMQLGLELLDNFVHLLKETSGLPVLSQLLTPALNERLMTLMMTSANAATSQTSVELVCCCFEALLECCAKSNKFWNMFRGQAVITEVIKTLLFDERSFIRQTIVKLISAKVYFDGGPSGVLGIDFAEVFWPIVFGLLPQAASEPQRCEELFTLASRLQKRLMDHDCDTIDLQSSVMVCMDLLLSHTSSEDVAHPETIDKVANGLISMLHQGVTQLVVANRSGELPTDLPERLFSKHLFPPKDGAAPLVPNVIVHSRSREMLYDIIYTLASDNKSQMIEILGSLDKLTDPGDRDPNQPYEYELPQSFDRASAIRSLCGYSGLRNLSNTCYLNSLFTQLFMNIGFRRFILDAPIKNHGAQQLLSETKTLFAYLQDSRRRFIDPHDFVNQITTYEELPIDIHNQMDVDEFFNLLFDRWEAEFSSESEKRALRSIYGGQLVQQVKSKECEHISERIEPFSAIQCDIKGKSSLEESLQAYVDGEIMEGDNKYKCSTCDRHVDAVKRACLKDLPDNLIFHLKRFDFNLRLLQRSKINDYFPFPAKIDMQPYTVGYLSDPSHNAQPDIFELVGVLVHSGTAETGHYYSFIRERPNNRGTASWVEFNDDIVTSWDPSQMENACFGGAEHRQYENGDVYDKVYSAYMLFYQRSSSLHQDQELLESKGNPGQFRADVPPELETEVKCDNWGLVQRHNMFDPSHMRFVIKTLHVQWASKCSTKHENEDLAMYTALGHLDQVASRAKGAPDFEELYSLVFGACKRCPVCSSSVVEYFRRHPEAFRMLLFRNSDAAIRQDAGRGFLNALMMIKDRFPTYYRSDVDDGSSILSTPPYITIPEIAAGLFHYIWEHFCTRPGAWPEYFGTMVAFAKLGRLECGALLAKDLLVHVLLAITADPALELPQQYNKLLLVLARRIQSRPPNYAAMIALADLLMDAMDQDMQYYVEHPAERLVEAQRGNSIPFTGDEINLLHKTWPRTGSNVFVDKLMHINQNPEATGNIIKRFVACNDELDRMVFQTLCVSISGRATAHLVGPYLAAASVYCVNSRHEQRVRRLIRHVTEHCRVMQNHEVHAFFEFQRYVFDAPRKTGESSQEIQLCGLQNLPVWAPGLLGYGNHGVKLAVEEFVREKIIKHGTSPDFSDANGGSRRSKAMVTAARQLAVNLFVYLHETYVSRRVQATRETVLSFYHIATLCEPYTLEGDGEDDELCSRYHELKLAVTEPLEKLIVDEIEDDVSEWEQSVGSSDSLADINMGADQDFA